MESDPVMNVIQEPRAVLMEPSLATERPKVRGKFLYVGDEKFWVRGVSYGTFSIGESGEEQLTPEIVGKDFAQMAENGFNVVRVHTGPPRWVLDLAQKNGLRVMVGLNWGEQMAFLDDPGRVEEIEGRVRRWVRDCAGHPAVFCYSVGNEITASIVRWHGRRRVEKFVRRLYQVAKEEDPDGLVTYVNYPSTEYLRMPFLDFLCFNVYLESHQAFADYLARLHSVSDERPVLLSEVGLDSLRNGEEKQAYVLDWQVRAAFQTGCCGVIVFAWTDEWYHGKYLVEDWRFGLTTRDRLGKPALGMVRRAFAESPFPPNSYWPKISVVVCSFNGASTICDTLDGLQRLDYPEFEVIVVNDGSTDSTPRIVAEYPSVKLVNTSNRGLSSARNTGIETASAELVAFIDDDAYPDELWLRYLASSLMEGRYVGVGGPNLPPPKDGWKEVAMSCAPGGPNAVLISDMVAEHIPGCNMMFRKDNLEAIGGFDPVFRTAGDDVDLCWRMREQGVIGFSPAAVVWHHRRGSIRRFWKQQVGYGKAEALLERKWPEKYNGFGQLKWLGRIYGKGLTFDLSSLVGGRVYQGVWGSAPFQSLYQSNHSLWSLTLMPEWFLITAGVGLIFLLSIGWAPWILFGPLLLLTIAIPIGQASINAHRAKLSSPKGRFGQRLLRARLALVLLYVLQPLARLDGRLRGGLTPWRRQVTEAKPRFRPLTMTMWREEREAPEATLRKLQTKLREAGALVRVGGDYDGWDLEVSGGMFGGSRLLLAVEEHAPGKQLLRYRITPKYYRVLIPVAALFIGTSIAAALSRDLIGSALTALLAVLVLARAVTDTGLASGTLRDLLKRAGAS